MSTLRRLSMLCFVILLFTLAAVAEEEAVRAERFSGLIESLNTSSDRRAPVLDNIYSELRGPNSREMQEALRQSLGRPNNFILQGIIEALARFGDAADVGDLEVLLGTTDKLEVKNLLIRLLPAFCLGGSERARFNYIRYATEYDRTPQPSLLASLRRPPLTRRGRLNPLQERLQSRIILAVAGQFDPVGAALRHIDDRLYGQTARDTVIHYVGNALGKDPAQWAGIWAAQGERIAVIAPDEVEELRLNALISLSDMGAEGLPEVIEAFRRLLATEGEVLRQATFDCLASMCRTAFGEYEGLAGMRFAPEDIAEADIWRRRRFMSAANLAVFASENAAVHMGQEGDDAVFVSVASCLGAALSFPDEFPDTGGALHDARTAGLARLEQMVLMPDLARVRRAAVAAALGEVGAVRAVSAISGIIDSPYCSPDRGSEGARMAEAAIDALRFAATGKRQGRDAARQKLLSLLGDDRRYQSIRAGAPPVEIAHMVLWRLQRLAKSNDTSFDQELWRVRLGW